MGEQYVVAAFISEGLVERNILLVLAPPLGDAHVLRRKASNPIRRFETLLAGRFSTLLDAVHHLHRNELPEFECQLFAALSRAAAIAYIVNVQRLHMKVRSLQPAYFPFYSFKRTRNLNKCTFAPMLHSQGWDDVFPDRSPEFGLVCLKHQPR
jgi:hypothetical protein